MGQAAVGHRPSVRQGPTVTGGRPAPGVGDGDPVAEAVAEAEAEAKAEPEADADGGGPTGARAPRLR